MTCLDPSAYPLILGYGNGLPNRLVEASAIGVDTVSANTVVLNGTPLSNLGEANTVINVSDSGNPIGLFRGKNGTEFEFYTISAGPNFQITVKDGQTLELSSAEPGAGGSGEVNTGNNLAAVGSPLGIFSSKAGSVLEFFSFSAGPNVAINLRDGTTYELSTPDTPIIPPPGENNTASNQAAVGSPLGLFSNKDGVDLEFFSFSAGPNTEINLRDGTTYEFSSAAPVGGGETNTAANLAAVGSPPGLFAAKVGSELQFYSISAGPNVALNLRDGTTYELSTPDTQIIPAPGENNTASNQAAVGSPLGLFSNKDGVDLEFFSFSAGPNININLRDGTTYEFSGTPEGGGGGASDFTDLDDTPANYTSAADKLVKVNGAGNGLEFADAALTTTINFNTDTQSHEVMIDNGRITAWNIT